MKRQHGSSDRQAFSIDSTMSSGAFDDVHDDPHKASDLSPLLLLHKAPHLRVIALEALPPSPE